MTGLRIGSMFTGAGGLDKAAQAVFGGDVVWVADNDPGARKLLAYRLPNTPNLGDLTEVDWSTVPAVDIITAGFPCTDISNAGGKAGITEGKASGLWSEVVAAVRVLRPRLVLLENVSAILVRGLDTVLSDLASLGYDLRWTCVQAAEVGAPHRRERWFGIAYPSPAGHPEGSGWDGAPAEDRGVEPSWTPGGPSGHAPDSDGGHGEQQVPDAGSGTASVTAADGESGAAPNANRERRGPEQQHLPEREPDTAGVGLADTERLGLEACRGGAQGGGLANDGAGECDRGTAPDAAGQRREPGSGGVPADTADERGRIEHGDGAGPAVDWGQFAAAIRRWEVVFGHPAPAPVVGGRRGSRVLNPAFTEWVMGLPEGWVTGVPGLTRPAMLRLLGNGVVPQQGAAAFEWLTSW